MGLPEADSSLLVQCSAIVVAQDLRDSKALLSLGHKVGFGAVQSYADSPEIGVEHQVVFFLVHHGIGDATKQNLLRQLRQVSQPNIKYAPVIAFVPDGDFEIVLSHIEMGFDDVICLPEKGPLVQNRLLAQLGKELTYIETATYLGPDRRRMELAGEGHPDRRSGQFGHANLTIFRSTDAGARVVRTHLFPATR